MWWTCALKLRNGCISVQKYWLCKEMGWYFSIQRAGWNKNELGKCGCINCNAQSRTPAWIYMTFQWKIMKLRIFQPRRVWWNWVMHQIFMYYNLLNMGLSENRVYSQWNSHLIGIMISKTIGFRGTLFSDTPIFMDLLPEKIVGSRRVWLICSLILLLWGVFLQYRWFFPGVFPVSWCRKSCFLVPQCG